MSVITSDRAEFDGDRPHRPTHRIRRPIPWAGALVTFVGLTAAIAVAAMAARAPLADSTPTNAASAGAPVTALFILLVGAGIVAVGFLAMLLWPGRRRKHDDELEPIGEPLQVHWLWKVLACLVPLVLGAALVAAAVIGARTRHPVPRLVLGGSGARLPTSSHGASAGASGFVLASWLPWTVLGILVLAIATGVILVLRRRPPIAAAPSQETAAHAAVQEAIRTLETPSDPRQAVIAAYASMQRTLAANGVARSPAEAPREYLRRVLTANGATEHAARTLTDLFEEARFSRHPIPERARGLALAALTSMRAQSLGT
jgi:Domain of unknown function (DUF4129)